MKKYIIISLLLIIIPAFGDDYKIICQSSPERLEKIIKEHLKIGWIVNGPPFTLVKSERESGLYEYSYNPSTTSICQCLIYNSPKIK